MSAARGDDDTPPHRGTPDTPALEPSRSRGGLTERRTRSMARVASHCLLLAAALLLGSLASARDLQQVRNTGTLRVGVTLFAPWAVRTPSGELVGFEIDV